MGWRTGLIVGLLMLLAATAQAQTFKVTTHLDVNDHACTPSKCSLRDAIIASNMSLGANTIKLRAGHYKLTIPGTREHAAATGDLNITNHVTIDGAGASTTTIDGNHIDRVFETFGGAKLTLSGVTVTGGAAVAQTPGSAVEGGAVLDDGGGPVTITNAAITGNTAAGSSGGAGGYGGAIDVEPPSNVAISLTNTTLSGNQAGGSSTADSGHGGAIDNQGPGTITLNHVSMTGNHAGGHQAGGYGGAANTEGPLVVSASTFTDNTAGGDGHFGYGGALDASTVTSTDSTFRGNDAGGGGASGDGHGGALELGVSATLTRSAIADNRAGGGGDGTGFGAFGYGGGVDAVSGAVTLSNSTVIGNSAGGGDQNSYGFGGGVDAALTATGSTIANNKVGGGDGFGDGGGIYGGSPGSTLTNSTVSGNSAGGGGADGFGSGGGIDQHVGTATLTFSDVVGNTATVESSTGGGGGVHGTVTSQDSIIADNTSATGANCDAAPISQGHNLENGRSCRFTGAGDVVGAAPLGPLQNNGGRTPTRALLGGPAINGGEATGCPASDQRGVNRPQGRACDIGAYEAAPPRATTSLSRIESAGHVSLSGVALNLDVVSGTEFFQFGKSTAYGKRSASLPLAAGPSERLFTVVIGRLTPGTLYHYRAADRNPDGTGFGADATFNTPAAPKLSKLTVHGRRVSYRDTEPGLAKFSVFAGHTKIARFSHRGIAGHNRFKFKKHLQPGAYVLKAIAYNSFGSPSKRVTKHFQVKG